MTTKKVGDKVPDFGLPMYVVLLREGGYVIVSLGEIVKIVENNGRKYYYPEDFPDTPCFDKWGGQVRSKDNLIGAFQGISGMDDPYYFRS
jgi:hypothetical protein